MDKDVAIELENFIFDTVEKPVVAAYRVADMVGVLIGLKPTMIGYFGENELKVLDIDRFEEILNKLDLEKVYFDHNDLVNNDKVRTRYFCISKRKRTAEQTREAFIELWSTMNGDGEIIDKEKWVNTTKKIGELLGYPKTAINDFVEADEAVAEDKERTKRMERNRYYAHSAKYEDEEFELYDKKLNRAISKLAPKTADFLSNNKKKRWLV